MAEKYVIEVGEGEDKTEILIERIIPYFGQFFFSMVNLRTGELGFGEYEG